MIGLFITAAIVLAGFSLVFLFLFPLARGAVYTPSSTDKVRLFAQLAQTGWGERAADLGSGDGRVVIALARAGAEAHGYEVNPVLVLLSAWNIRRAGLRGRAFVHWRSFWSADLSPFHAVTVFQGSFIMRRLEAKVTREMRPGARIVSDYWAFPTLSPETRSGTVYRYVIEHRGAPAAAVASRPPGR